MRSVLEAEIKISFQHFDKRCGALWFLIVEITQLNITDIPIEFGTTFPQHWESDSPIVS